jgi:hypothetical protein
MISLNLRTGKDVAPPGGEFLFAVLLRERSDDLWLGLRERLQMVGMSVEDTDDVKAVFGLDDRADLPDWEFQVRLFHGGGHDPLFDEAEIPSLARFRREGVHPRQLLERFPLFQFVGDSFCVFRGFHDDLLEVNLFGTAELRLVVPVIRRHRPISGGKHLLRDRSDHLVEK